MRDESGRVVPPGAFLPAVERYNLSQRLDRWVIDHGAAMARRESRRAPSRVARVFVNLSGDSVGDPQLQEFIRHLIARHAACRRRRLGFEITETAAIGNLTRANQLIGDLRQLGCAFGLDDFGSGVSSFAYLKALTVDFLKIDGLFIGNIVSDRIDYEMVRSITDIGHVMGKKVVAESVENVAVLDKLRTDRRRLRAGFRGRRAGVRSIRSCRSDSATSGEHDQQILGVDASPGLVTTLGDRAVAVGAHRRLHLHRFDRQQHVAARDRPP